MALPISMFTKGVLITTPPLIYIFVGDIPMNSLVGNVASTSQESNMNSDDPNSLPQGDSNVLPPNPVNPPDNNALPPIDPVVDNGNAKESDQRDPAGDPVVDNVVVQNTNPGVSEEGTKEDGHSSVDKKEDTDNSGLSGNSDRVEDGRDVGDDDDTDDEDDQEPTPDTSKNDELNEKLGKAGIDSSCYLPNLQTVGTCTLDKDQMSKINFPQKDSFEDEGDADFEITGLEDGEKVTITIESGYSEEDFPKGGLRITLNNPNSGEIKITGGGTDDEILKPNIDYDYKFSYATDDWLDKA